MSTDSNGAFKCLCPPKYGGAFCEGKPVFQATVP